MNAQPLISGSDLDRVLAWRADGPRRVRDSWPKRPRSPRSCRRAAHCSTCARTATLRARFAAGLIGGRISLQPSSQSAETLHDCGRLPQPRLPGRWRHRLPRPAALRFSAAAGGRPRRGRRGARHPADQLAAILFTSGSTGKPQAQPKTWGKLVANGGRRRGARAGGGRTQSSARYRCSTATVSNRRATGAARRLLVLGRQALLPAGHRRRAGRGAGAAPAGDDALPPVDAARRRIELPPTDLLLSATAPLSMALAAEAEARTGAPLLEIYGSTESGQLASRRTTAGDAWTLLPDTRIDTDGDTAYAHGAHVEGWVALSDLLETLPDGRFRLIGRHADLVNIAGRRTSLAYLNHQIAAIPGVVDAAFYLPDAAAPDGIARLTASSSPPA
jgi:hypothetical protein